FSNRRVWLSDAKREKRCIIPCAMVIFAPFYGRASNMYRKKRRETCKASPFVMWMVCDSLKKEISIRTKFSLKAQSFLRKKHFLDFELRFFGIRNIINSVYEMEDCHAAYCSGTDFAPCTKACPLCRR